MTPPRRRVAAAQIRPGKRSDDQRQRGEQRTERSRALAWSKRGTQPRAQGSALGRPRCDGRPRRDRRLNAPSQFSVLWNGGVLLLPRCGSARLRVLRCSRPPGAGRPLAAALHEAPAGHKVTVGGSAQPPPPHPPVPFRASASSAAARRAAVSSLSRSRRSSRSARRSAAAASRSGRGRRHCG
jgi:hypothetical protein